MILVFLKKKKDTIVALTHQFCDSASSWKVKQTSLYLTGISGFDANELVITTYSEEANTH